MLLSKAIKEFIYYLTITNKSEETIKAYNSDLICFSYFLEEKYNCPLYISEIKSVDIEDFLFYLKKRKLTTASRSRNLYTLRSFWNYAYKNKLCQWNIAMAVEPIKVQNKERTFLSIEEVHTLIDAIHHPLVKTVVQALFYTGMRISECLNLEMKDVDLENEIIHIINGKGAKDRNIPINKNLVCILEDYLKTYRSSIDSKYFFATEKSGHLSAPYVNRVLSDTVKELGWKKHVSAHILRHSFASNLIKNGVNLVYVQKLLGHSNLKVTSIYTHASIEDLNNSINLL
ncbi:tyrosine-type recombinase/integrase [Clostridium tetanomorphum]|uniref:Tyrosine-type recombinase/integrase n=1 Tax=Clostridium tetanomorphum TaxID=1553 RepID=A0A923E979_CLOTT|nr:tyrosine-type recombinase/integrase [Clostridium tetanomorphum]MBC2397051.1 tyrosine-type recombinase/integrase [Clostridium tetanomorphum]NRZ99107.1 site-specific recombinase XerD [Clostridium tetanomorphum]